MNHTPRNPSDSDEPLDPIEGADEGFPQTIGAELRETTSNVGAQELLSGQVEEPLSAEVLRELEDFDPQPSALQQLKALAARGRDAAKAQREADVAGAKSELKPAGDRLSALLGRVRTAIAEDEQLKAERRRAAASDYSGMSWRDREALRAKVLKWEMAREWVPVACVLVIERQTCTTCKTVGLSTYGVYQRQRRNITAQDLRDGKQPAERLVSWSPQDPEDETLKNLPKQFAYRDSAPRVCPTCDAQWSEVSFDWEKMDSATPESVMVGGDPPKLVLKAIPVESLETQPRSGPVLEPPKGTLTAEEEAEYTMLRRLSLTPGQHLSPQQRTRMEEFWEIESHGRPKQ